MPVEATRQLFLKIGKEQFLRSGYADTSLRGIAKKAGLTLGAFYRYFPTKEALFDALVKAEAEQLFTMYEAAHQEFEELSLAQKEAQMLDIASAGYEEMISYMCDHFDAFKLLFCCSAGTPYTYFVDRLIEVEEKSTIRFVDMLKEEYPERAYMDQNLIHILATTLFQGLIEVFAHNMSRECALAYAAKLREFYSAGWIKLLGIKPRQDGD